MSGGNSAEVIFGHPGASAWLYEELLTFRDPQLETEYRQQFHLGCCTYDLIWAVMMFGSAATMVVKSRLVEVSRLGAYLQWLYALTWLWPYPLLIILNRQQYASVCTHFHAVHHLYYVAMTFASMRTPFVLPVGTISCSSRRVQLSALLIYPLLNCLRRQLVFWDLLRLVPGCYVAWCYMLLSKAASVK